jgi:hypothetical protein
MYGTLPLIMVDICVKIVNVESIMLWTHVIISGELDLPYIDLHYADNTEVLP